MSAATRTIASPALSHGGFHAPVTPCPRGAPSASRLGFRHPLKHPTKLCGRAHCPTSQPRLVPRIGGWRDPATSLPRVWCEVRESCRMKLTSLVLRMAMGRFRFVVSDHYFQEERSALYTFPNLRNFRVAVLRDFRRVFAHVAPVFLDRGIANIETKELSSLSVEPCMGESIIVTVFEIPVAEVSAFIEREHEFRFLAVTVEDEDGQPFSQRAVVCARYSDEEYRRIRCRGSSEEYQKRYGKHNIQQIWRDDIFPCRVYLRHCVLAAKNLGSDAYNNFLDHTYLGDRTSTIRKYFEVGLGVGIMDEQAPLSLRDRYGG